MVSRASATNPKIRNRLTGRAFRRGAALMGLKPCLVELIREGGEKATRRREREDSCQQPGCWTSAGSWLDSPAGFRTLLAIWVHGWPMATGFQGDLYLVLKSYSEPFCTQAIQATFSCSGVFRGTKKRGGQRSENGDCLPTMAHSLVAELFAQDFENSFIRWFFLQ